MRRWLIGPALALALALALAAWDWPEWRGPDRTGVTTAPAPESWPEALQRTWRIEVGEGHASPVVTGDRVYAFSRERESEVLRAIELGSGEVSWQTAYEAPYRMNPAATAHGKGPKSTPLASGGRVFTLGIDGMVSCFDGETGRILWQKDFRDRFPVRSPLYGHGTSPALAGGKLLVHLGGPGRGALLALEPGSGRVIWAFEGDGPAYASPMVFDVGGSRQVVTQTDARVVGVALESGELLWSLPFTTPYDQNIFTAIGHGDRMIVSGLEQPTRALALDGRGSAPREVWRSPVTFYMSTPVLAGETLVGMSNRRRGQFVALDARTGEIVWESEGREGDNAAVVLWDDVLLLLTDRAVLHVLQPEATRFAPLRSYEVSSTPTWAHPVPTKAGILIKDLRHLTLFTVP